MSDRIPLAIRPERCDKCGKCVRACPKRLIRVGGGYIYIDVANCDDCGLCVKACAPGAITHGGASARVVVGSRAEAKAYKKQAEAASKPTKRSAAEKPAKSDRRTAAEVARPSAPTRVTPHAAENPTLPMQWTPIEAVLLFVVLAVAVLLKQIALGSDMVAAMPIAARLYARIAVLLGFNLAILGMIAFAAQRRGYSLVSAFSRPEPPGVGGRLANAGLVIGLLIGVRGFSLAWAAGMRAVGWAPAVGGEGGFDALFGPGIAGLVLALLVTAVITPVAEELLFRGVLLDVSGRRFGMAVGIVGTSLLYAASHLQPWTFASTFVLGLATGWLVGRRGSMVGAISLHALYNAVLVLAAYYVNV